MDMAMPLNMLYAMLYDMLYDMLQKLKGKLIKSGFNSRPSVAGGRQLWRVGGRQRRWFLKNGDRLLS